MLQHTATANSHCTRHVQKVFSAQVVTALSPSRRTCGRHEEPRNQRGTYLFATKLPTTDTQASWLGRWVSGGGWVGDWLPITNRSAYRGAFTFAAAEILVHHRHQFI